ncbi:hypothetical protein K491DRAFT_610687 [Lophiostoma macrostomum CBS 122681]|uniref:ATP-grasp domain-containing protein n=1 Tax=Lophiostoma macrostomum CBS 122681 TaxID=1314788 RepID=A0A6A6SR91_9PLEO|nr:hypothetical protein K491DRAFT_610687 [Lophiostoma macrostomum CBS 122681]
MAQQPPAFFYRHVPKNTLLILLSILCLPVSTLIVLYGFLQSRLDGRQAKRTHIQNEATQKTILVTGVSMTKGLCITRILSRNTPHRILGADIEHTPFTSPGRYSTSISSFHRLTAPDGENAEPYIDSLLSLIRRQKVDIWISCSSVVSAVEDGEVAQLAQKAMGSEFRAVQFSPEVVQRLHEKDSFVEYVQALGLPCPDSYRVTSADEVLDILSRSSSSSSETSKHGKHYILKPIAVNDSARDQMMTLLSPSSSTSTASHIANLSISPSNPFQLQQYIRGPEYCTHALVIRGAVRAFVACPSSDLLMHYHALAPDSALTQQMLQFTQTVAKDAGRDFTGHLSFDFLAEGYHADERKGELYAIECNPRAHTAVVLFQDTPEMAGAYLDLLGDESEKDGRELELESPVIVTPKWPVRDYCWLGHDLVTLIIIPFLSFLWGYQGLKDVVEGFNDFVQHATTWNDGTYVAWDPVPFFVLYHVYWLVQFARCLVTGKRWSRINVSTTKVFEAGE